MDPSSTPWRALEDAPDRTPQAPEPVGRAVIPRSAVVAGGAAVLLAIAAFLLAFSTGSGDVVAVNPASSGGLAAAADTSAGAVSGVLADPGGAGPQLIVEVVGAVVKPGVYHLPGGARVGDLIDSAGGYGPRVDTNRAGHELNLAAPLRDGDQIRVPSRDDPPGASRPPGPAAGSNGSGSGGSASAPVDLNHATATELDALPGIGPVTAAKIIAAREEQPFTSVPDLLTRRLVGEKTFASLKGLVAVR